MTHIEQFAELCLKLSKHGWRDLLRTGHRLDIGKITPRLLANELARPLDKIKRTIPGFEDFAADGRCGVEPDSPARSLLYHALLLPMWLSELDARLPLQHPTRRVIAASDGQNSYGFSYR